VDQLLAHPQLVARGMIQRLPHPVLGEMVVPVVVPKLSDTPGEVRALGPDLGQHNDEIYGTLLGLPPDELDRLRALKTI
jgi:formyl-CoA transferase